jgi:hypothetical protein
MPEKNLPFGVALTRLRQNDEVGREGWADGECLFMRDGVILRREAQGTEKAITAVSTEDVLALDWMVTKEEGADVGAEEEEDIEKGDEDEELPLE